MRRALFPAAILAAGVWTYAGALRVPFIFDDLLSVPQNATIRSLGRSLHPPPGATVSGRPLTNLTLAVNYALGGLDVRGYHLLNTALHLTAALLLLALLRRRVAPAVAFAIALLWTVHPLLTEAVVYVVQRSELLVAVCLLGTLYALQRWTERPASRGRALAALVLCAAGMGAKEVMVAAPVVVLSYDRAFLAGSFGAALRTRPRFYAALAATWTVPGALLLAGGQAAATGLGRITVTPLQYLLTQSRALLFYLRLAFWPRPLSIAYDWEPLRTPGEAWPWLLPVVALVAFALWGLARNTAGGFLATSALLVLAPSSSVVPIATELVAERRMYLPLAAVITLVALAVVRVLSTVLDAHAETATAVLLGSLAVPASLAARARVADYRTELAIWQDAAVQAPRSYVVHNNLGRALGNAGRWPEAVAEYEEALRLEPQDWATHAKLATALVEQGRRAEAERHYRRSLELRPGDARTHNNYARLLLKTGRVPEGLAELRDAVRLDADYAIAWFNLGTVLLGEGHRDEGLDALRHAAESTDTDEATHARAVAALEALRR